MNLMTMSRAELEKLRAEVDEALSSLDERERQTAIDAAEKAVQKFGFSLAELTGAKSARGGKAKGKSKSPAKYRNPENPSQSWTGRGRRPRWIVEAEDAGRPLTDFEI